LAKITPFGPDTKVLLGAEGAQNGARKMKITKKKSVFFQFNDNKLNCSGFILVFAMLKIFCAEANGDLAPKTRPF